jgi:diguanylate cyclase (GGDEF)-like protein
VLTTKTDETNAQPASVRVAAWFGRWGNALAGLLLFCVVLGLAEYIVELEVRDREARQRVAMFSFVSNLRLHVSREISRAVTQTAGLKSYLVVRHRNLRRAEVDAILEELYRYVPNVRNISLAVGFRIAYVHPVSGNEKAVGLDYRSLPDQWPDVMKAARTGEPVLVGPLDLIQGGRGVIHRSPVFIRGRYWGMLSTVFDAPMLFKSIFGDVADDRFGFAVRRSTGNAARNGNAVWGQQMFFEDANAEVHDLYLPGGGWELAVKSRLAPGAGRDILLLRGVSILLAAVLGWTIYLALVRRALLAQIALHDPLTGLPNRRLVEDRVTRALRRQSRNERAVGVILFIDLDGFKGVNDEHGHRAGDSVLQAVAERATHALRGTDTVGRWGGDELLVLMEDTDRAMIEDLTERVRRALELPTSYQGTTIKVGASIGRAVFPDDGASFAELVRLADQRMYEDKQRRSGGER